MLSPKPLQVRKVSNKLFSDPRSSVRRSQRLAALNNATAAAQGQWQAAHGGGTTGAGVSQQQQAAHPTSSTQGQAKSGQASYVEVRLDLDELNR